MTFSAYYKCIVSYCRPPYRATLTDVTLRQHTSNNRQQWIIFLQWYFKSIVSYYRSSYSATLTDVTLRQPTFFFIGSESLGHFSGGKSSFWKAKIHECFWKIHFHSSELLIKLIWGPKSDLKPFMSYTL